MIAFYTATHPEEARGVCRAASEAGLPCMVGFTVKTDGRLPCGQSLKEAIEKVDKLGEAIRPVYYAVNCSHPDHFFPTLREAQRTKEGGRL